MKVTYIGPYARRKPLIHQQPEHNLQPCCLCSKLTAWHQTLYGANQVYYCFDDLPLVHRILTQPNPLEALRAVGADL